MIVYTNLYEINPLQQTIIKYILYWAQTQKIPIPQSRIIEEMVRNGKNRRTVIHSLTGLVDRGYIRKAITNGGGETGLHSDKAKYVLIRSL